MFVGEHGIGESPIRISAWPILPSGLAMRINSVAPELRVDEIDGGGRAFDDEIGSDQP